MTSEFLFPLADPTYPFTTTTPASVDVPVKLPVSLGGHAYLVDTPQLSRQTIEVLRQALDTSTEPGQHSMSTAGIWSIVSSDWRHGTGQEFYDARDSDPRMFRWSKGLDPWTREKIRLLPATRQILASAATPLRGVSIDNELWAAGNGVLARSTNALTATPTFTNVTPSAPLTTASIVDACTDGGRIFTAHGANGIGKAAKGASSIAQFSTYAATRVYYANGRLFASKTAELVEISAAGTATVVWSGSGYGADEQIVAVAGTPEGIFVAYNTPDRGEVLYLGLNASTGALAVPLFAGELNKGETFHDLVYYQDLVTACTSRGVRLGTLGSSNRSVAFGPAIEIPNVESAAMWGQNAWFVWNAFDATSDGLGRIDLSVFTDTLVPAYASDLMIDGGGFITQVVVHQGQPIMMVPGHGLYGAHPTNLAPFGKVHSGYMRFGTFDPKVVVGVNVRHEPLAGELVVGLCDEKGTETDVGFSNEPGSLGPAEDLTGMNLIGEYVEVCITFTPSADATGGPVLKRWTLRGLNIPQRTDEILLPILMRSSVENVHGIPVPYDTLAEWMFLKALEASREVVTLVLGDHSEPVIVDRVGLGPERWTEKNRWFEGTVQVRLLTLQGGN